MTTTELDLTERRLAVAELAGAVRQTTVRDNTRAAFTDDWKRWEEFCAASRGQVLPVEVSKDALVLYAVWLARGTDTRRPSAPETIKRRLTGVLAGWRHHGLDYPRGITADARDVIDTYTRQLVEANLPTGRGKAPALTIKDARRIADTAPATLAGCRDLAVVLLGFAIAGRRSEIAHLLVTDITPAERGLYVHVRYSKTKPRRPAVLYGQNEATCPVRAWQRWQEAAGITDGAAFRRIDRHGRMLGELSGEAVGAIITRTGQRAGLSLRLTGHSVRAGLATEARRAGHDTATIADQGGWQRGSAALQEYIRIVDQWTDNALAGIGL